MTLSKMKQIKFIKILFFIITVFLLQSSSASAFSIEKTGETGANDFMISPSRYTISAVPGEKVLKTLTVLNRSAESAEFAINFQDMNYSGASSIPSKTGAFSDSSFSKYARVDKNKFVLNAGEKATVQILVDIPAQIKANGLQGAVLVSGRKLSDIAGGGGTNLTAELGSVFSIKITGRGISKGEMTGFEISDDKFILKFKNEGDVHLDPYGAIEIKDILGRMIKKIGLDPWLVLPEFEGEKEIKWTSDGWLPYSATAVIYPGYGGVESLQTATVWGNEMIGGFVILFFVIIIIVFVKFLFFRRK